MKTKRLFGLILAVVMIVTCIPLTALAAEPKPEMAAGGKLSDYFPDENFAKMIYGQDYSTDNSVLKKDASTFSHDYVLTEEDVNAIKNHKTINFHEDNVRDKDNNIIGRFGIQSIEGVGYFESLTSLTVSQRNSKLDGKALKIIPEELTTLTKLTRLNLFMNEITEIPESINNLTKLSTLNIGFNELTELPDSVFELTNLSTFTMSNNKLTSVKGIEKLTNVNIYSFAYNAISDLSGLKDTFYQRQATNQIVRLDAITVDEGATTFEYDLNDLGFVYDSYNETPGAFSSTYTLALKNNPLIAIYDNFETAVVGNSAYYPAGFPNPNTITEAMHTGATIRDRSDDAEKMYTLTFDADAEEIIIRVGDAKNINGNTERWTSTYNFDVTFIIPIERTTEIIEIPEEGIPLTPGEEKTIIIENEETPLAETPKTGDSSAVIFMLILAAGTLGFAVTTKVLTKKGEV